MAEGDRISVSEDKLYRALGDLELRLIKSITDALATKASERDVVDLRQRVASLETSRSAREHLAKDVTDLRKEFDDSQELYNRFIAVEADRRERAGLSFTKREKFMALLLATATVLLQAVNHWSFH